MRELTILLALAVSLTAVPRASAQETVETRIGDLKLTHDFANGYPTLETQQKLFDELDFQRACQANLWSIPIVSMEQWRWAHQEQLGAENGQIVFVESYEDKLGGLTYNTTTPYVLPFIDMNGGPWVVVMPEGEVRGAANDFFNPRIEDSHYIEGSMWEYATVCTAEQRRETYDDLDERAAWFYEAVTNDPMMQGQLTGKGQVYMATYRDSDGDWLDGGTDYTLTVPPDAPAEEFWSLTVYDVATRCITVNETKLADRSSRMIWARPATRWNGAITEVDLKIWDATMDDLQDIDIGSWYAPEFKDQRVPTLAEVLDECKGKLNVNIELKYYGHDEQLEQRVADVVDAHGMASDVVAMSLNREGVKKMKSIRPDWQVGLVMSVSAGNLNKLEADFLAVNAGFANRRLIRTAHDNDKDVYVWAVNDAPTMSAMISRGIDGLLTDRPALARSVLEQRAQMSAPERLLLVFAGLLGSVPELGEQ